MSLLCNYSISCRTDYICRSIRQLLSLRKTACSNPFLLYFWFTSFKQRIRFYYIICYLESVFKYSFQSQRKAMSECSKYHTIALISPASKVLLKVLPARLQQDVNYELPHAQDGFRKGRGTRGQIANICWIIEKAREYQKNTYFCFINYAKAFD